MSRFVFRAAALTVAAVAPLPAAAQFFDRPYAPYAYNNPPPLWGMEPRDDRARPLPPVAVVNRLEDQGFEDVGRPRYDGSTYTVDATAPNGRRVRLVIDAFRGRLLDRAPLGRGVREDDDDLPPRAFSRRGDPPPEMPFIYQDERRRVRSGGPEAVAPRREAARPIEPAEPRALPPPADPRLAPAPGETRSETTPARREAARPAPTGAPYGVNPGAPGPRRQPADAARSAPTQGQVLPAPSGPTPPKPDAPKAEASADPSRASRPVRVIGGVTPMNPDVPKPATEPSE